MIAVVVTDVHAPLHDPAKVEWALSFVADVNPDIMVLGGDTGDFAGCGDHPHERGEDYLEDIEAVAAVCRDFREASPYARHILMDGNHDDRNSRPGSKAGRYFRAALEQFRQVGEFSNWRRLPYEKSPRGVFKAGRMMVYHGHKTGKTSHFVEAAEVCRIAGGSFDHGIVVLGHTHRIVDPTPLVCHGTRVGLTVCNAGTYIDTAQATYAKNYVTHEWEAGVAVIDTDPRGWGAHVYRYGEDWDG